MHRNREHVVTRMNDATKDGRRKRTDLPKQCVSVGTNRAARRKCRTVVRGRAAQRENRRAVQEKERAIIDGVGKNKRKTVRGRDVEMCAEIIRASARTPTGRGQIRGGALCDNGRGRFAAGESTWTKRPR